MTGCQAAGCSGRAFAHRVVERQPAVVHDRQRHRAAERLRDARDAHEVVRTRRLGLADLAHPERVHLARSPALHDRDHAGRPARHRDQLVHGLLERLVGFLALRRVLGARRNTQRRHQSQREHRPERHGRAT